MTLGGCRRVRAGDAAGQLVAVRHNRCRFVRRNVLARPNRATHWRFSGLTFGVDVSIASTDVGFHSDVDCGTWTRIGAATASSAIQDAIEQDDIELQWLAHYQHRTGREPRPLIKQ